MKRNIDCLLIGHNQLGFLEFEETLRNMGTKSGAYRDLNLNFVRYEGRPYSAVEMYNKIYSESGFPPLDTSDIFSPAIAYLGSYLSKRGYEFDYVNAFRKEKEKLVEILRNNTVLTIGITTTFYLVAQPILEIIQFIKQFNDTAKIIVGGPFVSTMARQHDQKDLDFLFKSIGADFYVNSSQGETALVNLIDALKSASPPDQVNNIYHKVDGRYIATPTLAENNKLSDNPVNWDLFSGDLGEFAHIRTAISCPFNCSFCGFPQHAGDYQVTPVEVIEKELISLTKSGRVKNVYFIDDTFNVPPDRFKEILKMIIKNRFPFKWYSYFRCQFASGEIVQLMKESGCIGVFLGIESGNDAILKNMNKASSLEKYRKGIALLKDAGIVTFGSFIVGFPGETGETVKDTTKFIQESGLDFYRAQLWYCEPITPIWNEREKYGIVGKSFEWSHWTMNSRIACRLLEEMFLSVKNVVWVPQYDFDFINLLRLTLSGTMSLEQAGAFLTMFNKGIKEKLVGSGHQEVSPDFIREITVLSKGDKADEAVCVLPGDHSAPKELSSGDGGFAF